MKVVLRCAAALVAAQFLLPAAAMAGTNVNVPSVDILPVGTTHRDPNLGQWFVFRMVPGQRAVARADLRNPASVAQKVQIYAGNLDFSNQGQISLQADPGEDIGSWIHFSAARVRVPPHSDRYVTFTITVPRVAEPGDHIGALVAQMQPEGSGGFNVIKRVATRIYVTVPGVATRGFRLASVAKDLASPLWPNHLDVSAVLRNTGRISLSPTVRVAGRKANGSTLLLSESAERYTAQAPVPWYGGPVRVPVVATVAGLRTQRVVISLFVIPWALVAIVVVGLTTVLYLSTAGMRRRRARLQREAALHAQLQELQARVGDTDVPAQRQDAGHYRPLHRP